MSTLWFIHRETSRGHAKSNKGEGEKLGWGNAVAKVDETKNPLYVYAIVYMCSSWKKNFTRRGLEPKDDATTKRRQLRNGHICSHRLLTSHLVPAILEPSFEAF